MFLIDLKKLRLIKKYEIKFEKVENLSICYDGINEAELKYIDADIYPSKLKNFTFMLSENWDLDDRENFSLESFQNLNTLKTENCSIDIQNQIFFARDSFIEVLNLFEQALNFKFKSCTFYEWNDEKLSDLKEVKCKCITFEKCSYSSTKILKDVLSKVVKEPHIKTIEFLDLFRTDSKPIKDLIIGLKILNKREIQYVQSL